MKLEEVNAVLRPRRSWEAVDLGLALVRSCSSTIYGAWMLTAFPLYVLIALALWSYPGWAIFAIVFLKPLVDRVPLYVISRAMFGETPRIREVVRAFPGMLWQKAGTLLFTNRITMNRCFVMPVIELEGGDKKVRKERVTALGRLSDVVGAVSFYAAIVELCILLSLMFFTLLFIPESMMEEVGWSWLEFELTSSIGDLTAFLQYLLIYHILATTLVEPFYVGAGFGLYLNARSILEGWDVELGFRRLVRRLEGNQNEMSRDEKKGGEPPPSVPRPGMKALLLLLGAVMTLFTVQPTMAEGTEDAPMASELHQDERELAQSILDGDDFEVRKTRVWIPAQKESSESFWDWLDLDFGWADWLGPIIQVLFWLIVIAAVGGGVYMVVSNLRGKSFASSS